MMTTHGGKRENAGRKSTGRKKYVYYITSEEDVKLKQYLQKIRNI